MNLLAASGGWVLDIIFFVALAVGIIVGCCRGFVKGICKIAGTVFALIFAVCFCVPMENSLESTFGLTTALTDAIGSAIAAGWIAVAISFVALVVIIKLGAWLLGKLGTALVDKFAPVKIINKFLGGVLGFVKALVIILLILAICKWINLESINAFIETSGVVKYVYSWDWFSWAMQFPTQQA